MAQMNKKNFNELLESVEEVGLIEQGKAVPSREFVTEIKVNNISTDLKTFAICLSDEDEGLIPLKIYHVILQPQHKTCTVRDENGETTVCPIEWFLPVAFPSSIERRIEETELALA